ncbi:hypothetical protein Kpol_282p7 [Vanderwaltozyma polyspora DSM 70294]|uniref:EH domain-containing protein n=1 Tax=Vanderwaltozyma polyspora (strain ATCC 22028 / DSM 70294 / BCRC 21397 / CBS 2163 / NBRC 10782 / NRRL Y-8283 / UCD 57-17) TaxID=436907 RepID=A7TST3_VANPO|nr:uncharacterized protein Kpol_282p7 [Vanderwaltozyma polyspora DSM 70294]EDO14680.1 hypothetical protein Kpol_282p7 [Vanderwaltozyma polyspora DSM 70294]
MLFPKKKQRHHSVDLTQKAKDDSLLAAKLMFEKHSGNATTNNNSNTNHNTIHEIYDQSKQLKQPKPVRVIQSHKVSPIRPGNLDANNKREKPKIIVSVSPIENTNSPINRKQSSSQESHLSKRTSISSASIKPNVQINQQIKQNPPNAAKQAAAKAAAAIAHASLTDMEREWDLPLLKSPEHFHPSSNESNSTSPLYLSKSPISLQVNTKPQRPSFSKKRNSSVTSIQLMNLKGNIAQSGSLSINNKALKNRAPSQESIPSLATSPNINQLYSSVSVNSFDRNSSSKAFEPKPIGEPLSKLAVKPENPTIISNSNEDICSDNDDYIDPTIEKLASFEMNYEKPTPVSSKNDLQCMSLSSALESSSSIASFNDNDNYDYAGSIVSEIEKNKSDHLEKFDSDETSESPLMMVATNSNNIHPIPTSPLLGMSKSYSTTSFVTPATTGEPVEFITTYSALNKLNNSVTYQGTLPNLIANHVRKSKLDKLRNKFFKGTSAKNNSNVNSSQLSIPVSSITEDEEGRAVVRTAQNLRFKTTMRKKGQGIDDDVTINDQYDGFGNLIDDLGYDSDDSIDDTKDKNSSESLNAVFLKKIRKRDKLKEKLKHTASSVPLHYSHSHSHSKMFNEDKPWKSHQDFSFITENERKRYESMWVSNRYLYLDLLPWWSNIFRNTEGPDMDGDVSIPDLPEDGLILNLVAKDIWERSLLSNDLLNKIYELVDTRKDGTLDRKSFIVGMWLVDQCLYGRKLPKYIDQTVWESVDRYLVNVMHSATRKAIDKNKKRQIKEEMKLIKKEQKNIHA